MANRLLQHKLQPFQNQITVFQILGISSNDLRTQSLETPKSSLETPKINKPQGSLNPNSRGTKGRKKNAKAWTQKQGWATTKTKEFEVKVTTHCNHKALLGPKFGSKFNPYPLDPIYQWCWVAHLCSYDRMHSKGTFGPKVEECRNHHSKPAKMGGEAGEWRCVPKRKTCCQILADMSSISCTKTIQRCSWYRWVWIVFCTGEISLMCHNVVISPALVFECSSSVPCLLMNNETNLPEICLAAL